MGSSLKVEIIFPSLIAFQFLSSLITANPISIPPAFPPPSSSPYPIRPPTELQVEVCRKAETIDFNLCVDIIQSDPHASFVGANIKTLAGTLLQCVKEESSVLSELFDGILRDRNIPAEWKPALKLCAYDYKDAAIFFSPRGLGDVTKSLEIHSALDNSDNCESEMAKSGVRVDETVAAEIRRWKNLYAVANGAVLYAEDLYEGVSVEDYGDDY